METIEDVIKLGPILAELFYNQDFMMAITDTKETVYYKPGQTINLGGLGYKLQKGDGLYDAIESKQTIRSTVPKELLGVPFKVTTIPVFNRDNDAIGCIGLAWSFQKEEQIQSIAQSLAASLQQISVETVNIANSSKIVSDAQTEMVLSASETKSTVRETEKLTNLIKSISRQSHLLGLNAAIESARAGIHGKGFSVIAKEIGKLAEDSKNAVTEIESGLRNMTIAIEEILDKITKNSDLLQVQTSATNEINSSIQELNLLSKNLLEFAKEIN